MATYSRTLRRGLPREPGGEAWPPAGDAPVAVEEAPGASRVPAAVSVVAEPTVEMTDAAAPQVSERPTVAVAAAADAAGPARSIRRGLPRVPGGEPWPAAGAVPSTPAPAAAAPPTAGAAAAPAAAATAAAATAAAATAAAATAATAATPAATAPSASVRAAATSDRPLRRGLPRVKGGEPWPQAGFAPAHPVAAIAPVVAATPEAAEQVEVVVQVTPEAAEQVEVVEQVEAVEQVEVVEQPAPAASARPVQPTRPRPAAARPRPAPAPPPTKPGRFGDYTPGQLLGAAVVGGFGLLLAATAAVVVTAWFIGLPFMRDFLAAYPGEYELPEGAPVGIPAWLGWQHFFNVFLIVLIIRSGLQVRTEKRPAAYWTPRWSKTRKISLALWFHQSLDILWILNGVVFVVLLFTTGQWMKIVPTSWEVFPNAISAALQYVSLDWPTENGWVNYNSLQQLTYFATVFLAAPLAIITGVRMSGIWPKNAKTLNRVYPVEWARAVHFPVMLYFVAFIVVHVGLVLATGALRNLNHMYASQDAVNWVGFWIFVASLVVIVAAWVAARPSVLAPIAGLFGKVGR
ncbi:cytochrome b/b6 domain-containing protein [Agromyces sp. NPDC058484]|uniref:cytochrome b/b6 domain-containing protein n=1 Tax=Agromyces sp. NPDC058484 TaxID=3346524 RepID=UPI003661BD37